MQFLDQYKNFFKRRYVLTRSDLINLMSVKPLNGSLNIYHVIVQKIYLCLFDKNTRQVSTCEIVFKGCIYIG